MTDNIFKDNAPFYWAVGIPAMPLKARQKVPILSEWQQYGTTMPSEAVRAHWVEAYPNSNIGLPFGPASGLCAIDVDTLDQDQVKAIETVIGKSPWIRKGKKGYGAIFKWQGQRNFKIRDAENNSIVEFLGLGNQLVLPPSIHPETNKPYTSNTNLWEVMDSIPTLGVDIEEKLRGALGVAGFSLSHEGRSKPLDVVPPGERDIQLVRHAGYLARVVLGIDKNTRFSLSDAVNQMYHWVENYTATVAGDDMDPQKGVAKLLEFILKDIEAGRTLPDGWDADLSEDHLKHPTIAAIAAKNESERWTVAKAKDWINAQIGLKPDDDDWAVAKIMEIVEKVAGDENFSDFHFNVLCPVLERASGNLKMRKVDLTKQFKMCRKGEGEMGEDHEAIANQVIEGMSRGGELRHAQGTFWQWNGSCFGALDNSEVLLYISKHIKGNVLSRRFADYSSLEKMVAKMVSRPLEEQHDIGINFANGFLDSAGELHDHSPSYGKTFTMPFNYVPARQHEAHKWLSYLEASWGDDPDYGDKVLALQEAFAATMFGVAPSYERAILLHGKAGTGKTRALEVLRSMMPPAAVCSVPPHLWGERFATATLVGKALNVCGELPENTMIAGNMFKSIVEGTQIPMERKNQDPFDYKPFAANWFASNHLPRSRDSSAGFTRRWLILDFNRVVPANERVVDFHEVLIAEEREAIAAWAVEGLKRLQKNRHYTQPASHKLRINQITRSNNSVSAFLQSSERVRPQVDHFADARAIFDLYIFHMKEVSRGMGVTYETFTQMLDDLGYPTDEYRDDIGVLRVRVKGLKINAGVHA